jgi:hypothetical protein
VPPVSSSPRHFAALWQFLTDGGAALLLLATLFIAAAGWIATEVTDDFRGMPVTSPLQQTMWRPFSAAPTPAVEVSAPAELGVWFRAEVGGAIIGIRFYRFSGDEGPHTGSIWTSRGRRLATVEFAATPAIGWQEAALDRPLAIAADRPLVVSVFSPASAELATGDAFAGMVQPRPNGEASLRVSSPRRHDDPRFAYHLGGSGFPATAAADRAFWLDVVFVPDGAPR